MNKLKGNIALFITAIVWGFAFVAQSSAMDYVGPLTFLASRSFLGAFILLPLIILSRKKQPEEAESKFSGKTLVLGGTLCGLALFIGSYFQQAGILYTTVGKAGFITAFYVPLVPIFGLIFLHRKPALKLWLAVVLALAGLWFLSINGDSMAVGKGELLCIIGAIGFTVQVMLVDHFVQKCDAIRLSALQFLVEGIIALILAFLFEKPSFHDILAAWLPICYAGLISSGVGYTLQTVGQKYTDPTSASILMSLESVFALIGGILLLHQIPSARESLGCVLMFAAVIWSQLPDRKKNT